MQAFFRHFRIALPFTLGLLLTLLALVQLVKFMEVGGDLDDASFGLTQFLLLGVAGIPTLLFGIDRLDRSNPNNVKP